MQMQDKIFPTINFTRLLFAFVCCLLRENLINVKSNNCILFLITTKSRTRTKHDTKLKD